VWVIREQQRYRATLAASFSSSRLSADGNSEKKKKNIPLISRDFVRGRTWRGGTSSSGVMQRRKVKHR